MKRILIVLLLVLTACFAYADTLSSLLDLGSFIFDLANSGVSQTDDAVSSGNNTLSGVMSKEDPRITVKREASLIAPSLSQMERVQVFNDNKKNSFGPFCMALFLGCGSGQRALGDYKGSSWITPLDTIGLSTITVGGVSYFFGWLSCAFWLEVADKPSGIGDFINTEFGQGCAVVCLAGLGVTILSRVIGSIRTLSWANSYNRNLREGLGLDKNLQIVASPIILGHNGVGFKLGTNLSF